MNYYSKTKHALFLFVIALAFLFSFRPSLGQSDKIYGPPIVYGPNLSEQVEQESTPPDVILNDQKIIFKKQPVLDGDIWLFPLEEIAEKFQDKVKTDAVNRTIIIERFRDKSIISLDVKNGIVSVNSKPFRTLFGYEKIILASDSQMVPTSALVILLGLTSKDNIPGKLIFKSTIHEDSEISGTIQPLARKGIKDLLVDYLTVTNSFDSFMSEGLFQRRTEVNGGFHNDNYALTTDFITRAGTDSPIFNYDSGNVSYYKNNSPFQVHIGDKPLSDIRSPFIGGINARGVQVQTDGKIKDSKFIFGTGLLPSDSRIIGKALPFIRYGRLAQYSEWSSSPEKEWQFSIGEALYSDRITNVLIMSKESGGVLSGTVTKTGKLIEGNANLGVGSKGFGGDTLLRYKPKDWISFFSNSAYFSSGFYPLSANPFYNDRNQLGAGFNINKFKSNFGLSHSIGETALEAKKPNDFSVTNVNFSSTPFKKGPTFLASYSQNQSRISSTRAIDNLLFPVNMSLILPSDLDTIIERRTNSFFRASLFKSWPTFSISSSVNHFTFANKNPLNTSLIGAQSVTELSTYDLNLTKSLTKLFSLQTFFQGSNLYKQARIGLIGGPLLNKKLNFQVQTGVLLGQESGMQPVHTLNLNYQLTKRNQLSINYNKTPFISWLSAIWQYNLKPERPGGILEVGETQTIGRIKGKVVVLQEPENKIPGDNQIVLPTSTVEKGIEGIRVHLGSYTVETNEKGIFEFASLSSGTHRIRVEYSDLPAYLTSITPESIDIKVEPGKETNFNFVLAYFGSLSGKLSFQGEPQIKLEKEPELQDIRVYLNDSDFETLTNIDGTFDLGDVKPGKYTLKVDPDFLPEELETDANGIEIEIHSKDEISNVTLPIRYKARQEEIKEF